MPAMVYTTLTAAVGASDTVIPLTSITGVTAHSGISPTSLLYVDFELMEVVSVSALNATVKRGIAPTRATAHLTGSKVWVGPPGAFANGDPGGAVNTTDAGVYYPCIVPLTRNIWDIIGGLWVRSEVVAPSTTVNIGAAAAGVTAAEYGNAFVHQTKLTFTALALGTGSAGVHVGMGALLYTLPAGAILVNGSSMSVALTAAGTSDDASQPDTGLGTSVATGTMELLSETAAMENILTGQTAADCNGTANLKTVTTTLAIEAAGAHTVYLNAALHWIGSNAITATGTVILNWTFAPVA